MKRFLHTALALSIAFVCTFPGPAAGQTPDRQETTNADVIVYGSTPGGFCAAIAAAREGVSVILLEPTDHVGAMNTGGLSHCDSNQMVRKTLMGLFDEWHTRVVRDYTDRGLEAPYNPGKKDQARWTFEPHVAMRVTKQMLAEAGVTVLMERYLSSVTKVGPRITSLVTKNGTFTARVFVDGSYEGDLMAAAGVDWTIGREGREAYGAALAAQHDRAVQKIEYPKLRERLLAQKQVLDLPNVSSSTLQSDAIAAKSLPGIILDDSQAKLTGDWSQSTNFKPYIENGYVFSGEKRSKLKGDGSATATFQFVVPKSGRYRLLMAYSADETRAKNVPVTVTSGRHHQSLMIDQTAPLPDDKHFRLINTIDLQAKAQSVIRISNADTTGFVILDALQLIPIGQPLKKGD